MEVEVRSPFPFEALPRIWRWIEPFRAKVSDDFSPQTLDAFVEGMAAKWDAPGNKSWAVYGDGEMGGLVTFEKLSPWVGTAHFLLKPEFQRQGLSVKAARMVAAAIFEHEGIGKLVFYPLAGNLAIGSLLINIGAKREGTLEAQTLSGGKPTAMWVYGLTKEGFSHAVCSSSANYCVGNRSGSLDRGISPVGEAKDRHPDEQHHADTHAPDASPDGSVEQVLNGLDQ